MTNTTRIIFNILAQNVEETAAFYEAICGLKRIYSDDWYVVLSPQEGAGGAPRYELGIIDQVRQSVPQGARGMFGGGFLTIVVDDLDSAYQRAKSMDIEIVTTPDAVNGGQGRMLLRDMNNVVVELLTQPSSEQDSKSMPRY